jgi:hypothetical protein
VIHEELTVETAVATVSLLSDNPSVERNEYEHENIEY